MISSDCAISARLRVLNNIEDECKESLLCIFKKPFQINRASSRYAFFTSGCLKSIFVMKCYIS